MNSKYSILFYACNQPSNLGDVLLNRAIVKYLSSKSDVFVDPGKFKGEDKDTFILKGESLESKVTQYDIKSLRALFDIFYFKKFDYFIMSAGMSASNSKIRYFLNRTKLICILLLLKCRGIKMIIPNTSFDVNEVNLLVLFLERIISKLVYVYGVRDNSVSKYLTKSGINCRYIPDVFFLNTEKRNIQNIPKKKRIILNFRESIPEIIETREKENYREQLIKSIESIVHKFSDSPEIICVYQCLKDKSFTIRLFDKLKGSFNATLHDKRLNYHEAKALYQDSICVLSNRLHCIFLGFSVGTLSMPLSSSKSHRKLYGSMSSLNVENFFLDIESKSSLNSKLIEQCINDEVSHELHEISLKAKEMTESIFNDLLYSK
tara:strand:- start:1595 stop:2722 length:1128 start_codon:yes stop_codon:yes gene_type:complete